MKQELGPRRSLIGLTVGRLTVTALAEPTVYGDGRRVYYWTCACVCGRATRVSGGSLTKRNPTRSCGCLTSEATAARNSKDVRNEDNPAYKCWSGMKTRCLNPKHGHFKHYGGRGVSVCQRWLDSFEAFLADVGPRPSMQHTLDRYPNKDGNYEPGNVRWATRAEQQRNKRDNRAVTLTVADWAEKTGLHPATILDRLRRGWGVEKTLTTPTTYRGQKRWQTSLSA